MSITGLDHITINVKDLEKSRTFYGEILGLEEAGFIHMGDHTLTYFRLPQGVRLELIDYENSQPEKQISETDIGTYRHFCLETDELDGLYQLCTGMGIPVRKAPSYVEKLGCSTMLITDPNGVELEIIQR